MALCLQKSSGSLLTTNSSASPVEKTTMSIRNATSETARHGRASDALSPDTQDQSSREPEARDRTKETTVSSELTLAARLVFGLVPKPGEEVPIEQYNAAVTTLLGGLSVMEDTHAQRRPNRSDLEKIGIALEAVHEIQRLINNILASMHPCEESLCNIRLREQLEEISEQFEQIRRTNQIIRRILHAGQ